MEVIMYDIEAMRDQTINSSNKIDPIQKKQFMYHYKLAKGNLKDLMTFKKKEMMTRIKALNLKKSDDTR